MAIREFVRESAEDKLEDVISHTTAKVSKDCSPSPQEQRVELVTVGKGRVALSKPTRYLQSHFVGHTASSCLIPYFLLTVTQISGPVRLVMVRARNRGQMTPHIRRWISETILPAATLKIGSYRLMGLPCKSTDSLDLSSPEV